MTSIGLCNSHALDNHLDRACVVWLLIADTLLALLVICHVLPGVGLLVERAVGQAGGVVWGEV